MDACGQRDARNHPHSVGRNQIRRSEGFVSAIEASTAGNVEEGTLRRTHQNALCGRRCDRSGPAVRADFSDQHALTRDLGVPVRTYLRLDTSTATLGLAAMTWAPALQKVVPKKLWGSDRSTTPCPATHESVSEAKARPRPVNSRESRPRQKTSSRNFDRRTPSTKRHSAMFTWSARRGNLERSSSTSFEAVSETTRQPSVPCFEPNWPPSIESGLPV